MRVFQWLSVAAILVSCVVTPIAALAQAGAFGIRGVVILPKAPASFDLSWGDSAARRYYLSDRTNNAVDVIDTGTEQIVALIPGFAGATGRGATAGPNGLV